MISAGITPMQLESWLTDLTLTDRLASQLFY